MLKQPGQPSARSGALLDGVGARCTIRRSPQGPDWPSVTMPELDLPGGTAVPPGGDAAQCVAAAGQSVSSSGLPGGGGGGQSSVLVADDNDDVVQALTMLLEISGFDVIKAYDGLEAVAAAEREQPDIVLLDIGMPGLDGHAACRRIRALPQGGRLRIIALSGWGQDSDARRSTESGFDGHLVKPVESAELLRALHGA